MRFIALFVLITILIMSCSLLKRNSARFQNQIYCLTNDSVKYWQDIWKKPYYQPYKEGGIALFQNGNFSEYQNNYENKRIIVDNLSNDIICRSSTFFIKSDTFYLKKCGWTFIFKILTLTDDSLQLMELTDYKFFPDTVPVTFIRSRDQKTKLVNGSLINPDTNLWHIRAVPVIK